MKIIILQNIIKLYSFVISTKWTKLNFYIQVLNVDFINCITVSVGKIPSFRRQNYVNTQYLNAVILGQEFKLESRQNFDIGTSTKK